jgi:tetratricopeptide (TPR) repeat protein
MPSFLLIMSFALVLMWTVRLARVKGRNPWIWGAVCLAPMFLPEPWQLLSMVPMVGLLFLKAPRAQRPPGPQGINCPRCAADQPHGRYYCTNCGWELVRTYPEDAVRDGQTTSAPVVGSVESSASPVAAPAPEQVDPAPLREELTPSEETAPSDTPEPAPVLVPEEEAEPARVFRGPPTAAGLTERGIALFNQRRIQEAIDQFTKALALDPNYSFAWQARADAYTQLGREDAAAEDRRRLRAIKQS